MNKIYRFSFIAIAFIVLLACRNLEESVELALSQGEITVLSAGREGLSPATKTVRQDGGSVLWQAGEAVSVFSGVGSEGGSKYVSTNKEYAEKVELKGPAISSDTDIIWAVYPYSSENSCDGNSIVTIIPAVQKGVDDNFSGNVFPAVAKSNTTELSFRNICGGIKFSVTREDIRSITIEGNANEVLAGKVKVAMGSQGTPEIAEIISGETSVTLIAPNNGFFKPEKFYYMSLLPTNLDSGFSIMIDAYGQKGKLERSESKIIKRSIFGVLNELDTKEGIWNEEPDAVDLGLSVRWASFNVGATKPEEYGGYFAWGETDSNKGAYSWNTYKWNDGSTIKLTKYYSSDNKISLDPDDDAALVHLGEKWRMPTSEELNELINGCTWTKNTLNGVEGYVGVSKNNGNTIFLPMGGVFRESEKKEVGETGVYWSSDLVTGDNAMATSLFMMSSKSPNMGKDERRYGYSLRAVVNTQSNLYLNESSLLLSVGETANLVATVVLGDNAHKTVTWISSNENVASVDSRGRISALSAGNTRITAKSGEMSASCLVIVVNYDLAAEVVFEDEAIKRLCLVHFDNNHDGTITYRELGSVTSVGGAFSGTTGTSFTEFQYFVRVTDIGYRAFLNSKIEKIILPGLITSIGKEAFSDSNLKEIVFSESITTIGDLAFSGSKIEEIVLPESTISIGKRAFANSSLTKADLSKCKITVLPEGVIAVTQLKELLLPPTLQRIEDYALSYNHDLSKLVIPASVNYIARGALKEDGGIVQLYMQSHVPLEIYKNWKYLWQDDGTAAILGYFGINDQLIVYVPQSAYSTYKSNQYWSSAPLVGYPEE